MTKKQDAKGDPKLIKLSKKVGYVAVPAEALKELFDFATACSAADDKALNTCSERLVESLSEFAKALDTVRDSDGSLYMKGLLAQAGAALDSINKEHTAKPQRVDQVAFAQRRGIRAAVPSRTDFLK